MTIDKQVMELANVVYGIVDEDTKTIYVGMTTQKLKNRIGQHLAKNGTVGKFLTNSANELKVITLFHYKRNYKNIKQLLDKKEDFKKFVKENEIIAVATSGGSDSMALLHYAFSQSKIFGFNVIALNVEHGIRGKDSVSDTDFVKNFCLEHSIPIVCYSVDCIKKANEEKLSIEQAARILRYDCFFDAIKNGKCDKVATAHHIRDNAESVLFNLFRGTGLKGVSGIEQNFENKIIRPFLNISKEEIEDYVTKNSIPFVTDQTNFSDDYTRNFIRHKILPKIKEIFPETEKSISRFAEIARLESDYLEERALDSIVINQFNVKIPLTLHPALLNRAIIIALKTLGIKKDWEKVHLDSVACLIESQNGTKIDLPKNVVAIKEYDHICIYEEKSAPSFNVPFRVGEFDFDGIKVEIKQVDVPENLKNGWYCDGDKIPQGAVIRTKKDGDVFTKFGGGTKSLSDFLTDKKIPLRMRDRLPVLATENNILAIFGVAISDKIKVDSTTTNILKLN